MDCSFAKLREIFSAKSLSIARVSSQIRHEVLPVLYGRRTFSITEQTSLCDFLLRLKYHRIYLRSLDVDSHLYGKIAVRIFRYLKECPHLQRLAIFPEYDLPDASAEQMYEDAKEWIRHVAIARGNKHAALEILSVDLHALDYVNPDCVDEYSDAWVISTSIELEQRFKEKLQTCIDQDTVLEGWFSVRNAARLGDHQT